MGSKLLYVIKIIEDLKENIIKPECIKKYDELLKWYKEFNNIDYIRKGNYFFVTNAPNWFYEDIIKYTRESVGVLGGWSNITKTNIIVNNLDDNVINKYFNSKEYKSCNSNPYYPVKTIRYKSILKDKKNSKHRSLKKRCK